MEKINGKITILIDREQTRIEVYDDDSNITFLEIELTPEQLSSVLSRLGRTDCQSMKVRSLNRVGKVDENKTFEFEIPYDVYKIRNTGASEYNKSLGDYSQKILDQENDGWVSDRYFQSQNSIFFVDEKPHARCIARRWVEKKV